MRLLEIANATGATFRQIDLWYHYGMRLTKEWQDYPLSGQGIPRDYDPQYIPRLKLMAELTNKYGACFPVSVLQQIFDNYEEGSIELVDGIILKWEPYGTRGVDASPERGTTVSG